MAITALNPSFSLDIGPIPEFFVRQLDFHSSCQKRVHGSYKIHLYLSGDFAGNSKVTHEWMTSLGELNFITSTNVPNITF
jgi:hypothetical protein